MRLFEILTKLSDMLPERSARTDRAEAVMLATKTNKNAAT